MQRKEVLFREEKRKRDVERAKRRILIDVLMGKYRCDKGGGGRAKEAKAQWGMLDKVRVEVKERGMKEEEESK
jgi:hypothetical protein